MWDEAQVVGKNAFEFVDAACLSVVSGYAMYQGWHNATWFGWILRFAGAAIALQAFVLLVRHFNKPEPKTFKK